MSALVPSVLLTFTAGGSLYNIVVDCSLKESHASSSDTTDHAVEKGADITDHVRPKPKKLSLTGLISNAPLTASLSPPQGTPEGTQLFKQYSGAFAQMGRVVIGTTSYLPPGTQGLQFPTDVSRTREVHDAFCLAQAEGSLMNVVTSLASYSNMVIESYEVPRDVTIGDALRFTMQMKNILVVTTQDVDVKGVAPKLLKAVKANTPVKVETSVEQAKTKSLSAGLADSLFGK